jgi:hypothetical protein
MTVDQKTPWKLYIAVGAVLAGGGLWLQAPSTEPDKEKLLLTVSWTPVMRSEAVDVRWALNHVDLPHETQHRSPWNREVTVATTATLTLSGYQATDGKLKCAIFKKTWMGLELVHDSERNGIGSVRCYYPQ